MSGKVYTVKQGDSLSGIAAQYRISDWKKIYNDPTNADFRRKRPNPNLLYPGDEVVIPEKGTRTETGATEMEHRYVHKRPQTVLRLVMRGIDGDPLGGCAYRLEMGGQIFEGTTGGGGLIEHPVSPDSRDGELTLWLDAKQEGTCLRWMLKLGHLDPVEYLTGVQARLSSLGFYFGRVDGENGPLTQSAVRMFQEKHRLKVDGIPGPVTQGKIAEIYGC